MGATSSPTTTASSATTATTNPSETDGDTTDDGGDDPFVFEDGDPAEYARIDRLGMPGVAVMLIDDTDAYNDGDPADDVAEVFVPEIVEHLSALHEALDGDLVAMGLTPCALPQRACDDPHGSIRVLPEAAEQLDHFLRTGEVRNFCPGGVCSFPQDGCDPTPDPGVCAG